MASLILPIKKEKIRILDPGAGSGILSVSAIEQILIKFPDVKEIEIVAVEVDNLVIEYLERNLLICKTSCEIAGVGFDYKIIENDFIEYFCSMIEAREQSNIFELENIKTMALFDIIILNPPYKKIKNASYEQKILNRIKEDSANLYTAFLTLSRYFLSSDGQIIAITPRSFCNGTYFKKFRKTFFSKLQFRHIHTYASRSKSFREDNVLQENIIFSVSPIPDSDNKVIITSNESPEDHVLKTIKVAHEKVINPSDEDKIIHIINDEYALQIINKISKMGNRLNDLGLEVSTGKVVDFRVKNYLIENTLKEGTALFYPGHILGNRIIWPRYSKKKREFILINEATKDLLVDSGYYVFCKRFSSKEEKKRIVAAIYDPSDFTFDKIAIENHLNYFHTNNKPLPREIAIGLSIYLNSTLVDEYFRIFNGHTQVNAEDLRYLPFPNLNELIAIGNHLVGKYPNQEEIDQIIEKEVFNMASDKNPININKRLLKELVY